MITGDLLAFAASWAWLAAVSILWTAQPQRKAAAAGFMGIAGAALLAFAPGDRLETLGGFGLLFSTLLAATGPSRPRRRARVGRNPVLAIYALCALGGATRPSQRPTGGHIRRLAS